MKRKKPKTVKQLMDKFWKEILEFKPETSKQYYDLRKGLTDLSADLHDHQKTKRTKHHEDDGN